MTTGTNGSVQGELENNTVGLDVSAFACPGGASNNAFVDEIITYICVYIYYIFRFPTSYQDIPNVNLLEGGLFPKGRTH